NLLALCPNCHSLHTAGHIPASAIRLWKGLLVALNEAFDRKSMDLLLFLKTSVPGRIKMWFSADGVLAFAGLFAAGLVQFSEHVEAKPMQIPESRHRISLTRKGNMLVGAWLTGDEEEYRKLLGQVNQKTTT